MRLLRRQATTTTTLLDTSTGIRKGGVVMAGHATRREAVAGIVFAGLGTMLSVPFANASEDGRKVDESYLAGLAEDGLTLLEQMVAGEKQRRDIKSVQMQAGMYVVGADIDPGSYILHACTEDGSAYESEKAPLMLVFNEVVRQGDSVSYDPDHAEDIAFGNDCRLHLNDGDVFEVQLRNNARCLISPASRVTF